jgi:hypothetical protein
MTKEEALEYIEKYEHIELYTLINKIYDRQDSLVCKNCQRFKDGECRIFQGAKAKCTIMHITKDNFYCKFFKKKEDNE